MDFSVCSTPYEGGKLTGSYKEDGSSCVVFSNVYGDTGYAMVSRHNLALHNALKARAKELFQEGKTVLNGYNENQL